MKVNELIRMLSDFPQKMDVIICGIVDVDELPESDDWSEDIDYRDVETDNFDVYLEETEEKKQIAIQFFMHHTGT